MPWTIGKSDTCPADKPFAVIKDENGEVEGCHATQDEAGKHIEAMYAAVYDDPADEDDRKGRSIPAERQIERRDAFSAWGVSDLEIRAEQGGMTFRGYAAIFDSPSEDLGGFRETIKPGAFKRSVSHAMGGKRDVKMFLNHNTDIVLGSTRAKTLRLKEDERGLMAEAILPNSPWGESVAEAVRRQDISSMSFGFVIDKRGVHDSWSPDKSQRTLHEVRLLEVSPVTGWPAYAATSASIRSLIAAVDWTDEESAQRVVDTLTDDQKRTMLRLLNKQQPAPYIAPDVAAAMERLAALKARR